MRISVIIFLLFTFVTWTTEPGKAAVISSQTIRVAIVKHAASVMIEGDGLLIRRENGDAVAVAPPVTIRPGGDGILMDGVTSRRLFFAAPGAVRVNGKPYRGMVDVSYGDRGLLIVNELPLEEYLVGLINCEVSSSWPIEAVKAQAVIARSYALYRKKMRSRAPYHLESTVLDQVYDGCLIEDSRAKRAVSDTAGEVLTYNGVTIQAFYHSSCGGKTESAENIWGLRLPYLKGVTCEYCLGNSSGAWEQKLELNVVEDRLLAAGFRVSGVSDIRPGGRNSRGRLRNIVVMSKNGVTTVGGDQFRKALGYGVIKSTNFAVTVSNGVAVFNGIGNGHGVGLCQWGAKQRALNGFSYTEILSYYYPGTTLVKAL